MKRNGTEWDGCPQAAINSELISAEALENKSNSKAAHNVACRVHVTKK